MFEKLVLKNFQCHRTLALEFDPRITCLVGPTDSGKSAVVRALRWVCLNKLAGNAEDYIRWGKDGTGVVLTLDGGRRIVRRRLKGKGKGENTYHLDGGAYKAFRDGVPQEIDLLLAVDADTFQRQLDAQFWLTDSAGQVAKNLNSIVNLEVMDEAQARANKLLRDAKSREEVSRERLSRARAERKELLWVVEADRLLSNLEQIDKRLSVKRSTVAQAGQTVRGVVDATRARDRAATGLPEGLNAVRAGERYRRAGERVKTARELVTKVARARELLTAKPPDLGPMLVLRAECDLVAERRREAAELVREFTQKQEELCQIQEKLRAGQHTLNRLRPKKCPTCGQALPTRRGGSCSTTAGTVRT